MPTIFFKNLPAERCLYGDGWSSEAEVTRLTRRAGGATATTRRFFVQATPCNSARHYRGSKDWARVRSLGAVIRQKPQFGNGRVARKCKIIGLDRVAFRRCAFESRRSKSSRLFVAVLSHGGKGRLSTKRGRVASEKGGEGCSR